MEREHRKRVDQGDGGASDRQDHEPAGKVGGGRALRAQDEDADDDEPGASASAKTSRRKESIEDIEDNVKDAWLAIKDNEKSILRGMYGRLKEENQQHSASLLQTLFKDLTTVGFTTLLAKAHPGAAVATILASTFTFARDKIVDSLSSKGGNRKIDASEFLESYVRKYNGAWLEGATFLESKMNTLDRKGLKSLRTTMKQLFEESKDETAAARDKVLDSWMHMLNQEHKQQTKEKDFNTETSGRLHLSGVEVIQPPEQDPQKPFRERITGLTARLDGTGSLRNQLLPRRLDAVKVPVSVAGSVTREGQFSFGVGSNQVPQMGPSSSGIDLFLERYGGGKGGQSGLNKLWNKMRSHTVGDLVGDNKPGGKTDDVLGGSAGD